MSYATKYAQKTILSNEGICRMGNIFDLYVRKYDAWYDTNKFAYQSELKALKKMLPKKGKGLEIGVGTGRFAGPLGIEYGIDPSVKMIRIARSRGVKAKIGSGEDLPFADHFFDYVAIINALCFVNDPIKVLEEAKRVLKKDGKIIVGIIDRDSFLGKFYQKKKSVFYAQAHFLSVRNAAEMLKKAGFRKMRYQQALFKLPDKLEAVEKTRNSFGKGGFVVISSSQ